MNKIQIWWAYFKQNWLDWESFEKHGGGMLPCKRCGKMFYSYTHFSYDWGQYDYDCLCRDCDFLEADQLQKKREVENILSDVNSFVLDWDAAKNRLAYLDYEIRYAPGRCRLLGCRLRGDEPMLGEIMDKYLPDSPAYKRAKEYTETFKFKLSDKVCSKCFHSGVRKGG